MTEVKRLVTQEELDALLRAHESSLAQNREETPRDLRPKREKGLPLTEGIGLHLEADRSSLVYVGKGQAPHHVPLNSGFEAIDDTFHDVCEWMEENGIAKAPVHLALSGKHARFTVVKTPKLAQPLMLKAFKLQLKQATGVEAENVTFVPLAPGGGNPQNPQDYLVTSVDKTFRESIVQAARRHKLKLAGWDIDILSLSRAGNLLWQREGGENSTRFLINLDWDHCHLLIGSPQGHLITLSLSIGMNSFMEHLVQARAEATAQGHMTEEEDVFMPSADASEVRQRRLLARQAIQDVYVPFAQQVKTQLYSTCNEYGISLPTHFAIVGAGSTLLGIRESLALDFGIRHVSTDKIVPTEMLAAMGALINDKSPFRVNLLPKGAGELWKNFSKELRQLGSRLKMKGTVPRPEVSFAPGMPVKIAVGGLLLLGLGSIPVYQRVEISSVLEAQKAEKKKLLSLAEQVSASRKRDEEYKKKSALLKLVQKKKRHLSRAMKEIINIRPTQIKVAAVSLKNETITVKGSAKTHDDVQAYLKSAQSLTYLSDPMPIGVIREDNETKFEISFVVKK